MSNRIPEEWTIKPLSELANVDQESLKNSTQPGYTFRYIDIASVKTGSVELLSEKIAFSESPSRARKVVRRGDVLMSTVRPNLQAFAYFNHEGEDFIASTGFAVITANKTSDGKFLYQSILADDVSRQIAGLVAGSNYPAISSSNVKNLELVAPPLPEQKKIAAILSSVDVMIEKTRAQIDKLKDLKTGMMQELLTKGIDHTEFKGSPVGRIPADWDCALLEEVAAIQTGVAKNSNSKGDMIKVPYLRVANVQDGYLNLTEIKYIEIDKARLSRFSLQPDDVLVNEGGDFDKIGRGAIWKGLINPCIHQNHVFVVRTIKNQLLPEFFNYLSGSQYGKNYYLRCAKQTTNLASLNSSQLKMFPVLLPSIAEQEYICKTLGAIDERQRLLEEKLARKVTIKKALMQDLLTGKVRVDVDVDVDVDVRELAEA